jgi:hypothetical protein
VGVSSRSVANVSQLSNDFDYYIPGGPVSTIAIRLYDVYSGTVANTPIMEWQVYAATGCVSPADP